MTEAVGEPRREGIRVVVRHVGAWLIGLGRSVWLFPLDATFKTVGLRYRWLTLLCRRTPPAILAGLGRLRTERASWRAARSVPAYRDFLVTNGADPDDLFPLGIPERLPETEKQDYIDLYGLPRSFAWPTNSATGSSG